MRFHGKMKVNQQGNLEIGGCDTVDLANEYGTPVLVIDEAEVRRKCREYRSAYQGTGIESEIIYASKAFLTVAHCRILEQEGLGIDVVSGGELYIAEAAGFPMEKVYFHGNNKTPDELRHALDVKIGRFIVDNLQELRLLNDLARERGVIADVLFRLTPGVEAHTHEYIQTGQLDSKFGMGISNGIAMEIIREATTMLHIRIRGIHCHIGSQIFNLNSFAKACEIMMDFCGQLRDELDLIVEELNMGGGIGIPYQEEDPIISVREMAQIIATTLKKKATELDLQLPKIINEPGRSIIGTAGTILYTVGSVKEIPDIRTYISVDGGMTDNIRPALYNASYEAFVANKVTEELTRTVTVTGRCCESGDMVIHDLKVPKVEPGDLLAVTCSGAYSYSMSSNYNGLTRPAIILVQDGKADLMVRREKYEDLIARDVIPERLK